jgi:hypothetical protein
MWAAIAKTVLVPAVRTVAKAVVKDTENEIDDHIVNGIDNVIFGLINRDMNQIEKGGKSIITAVNMIREKRKTGNDQIDSDHM